MIDKQNFYHGAALIEMLQSKHCNGIRKHEFGFLVNDRTFVAMKYTTKGRSPWRFTFLGTDFSILKSIERGFQKVVIVLICGGDGICPISLENLTTLIKSGGGWVSVSRNFHKQYQVKGSCGALEYKLSSRSLDEILFSS